MKILIADDELRMRRLVSDFLKREGYQVVEAENGHQALAHFMGENGFDLLILDVMMPLLDGWQVLKEVRKTSDVPIIMLTAKSEESDELLGFGLGSDEYITKPFSPMILMARVNAIMKRTTKNKKALKEYKSLKIDNAAHNVFVGNEKVDLSPKEFELINFLTDNHGIALSRDQILNAVWGFDYFGDGRTVDTHIKKLRLKLGETGEFIQTVRGHGDKFEVGE